MTRLVIRESAQQEQDLKMERIFILSPASTSGKRAAMVLNDKAQFELAQRLRTAHGAPLGEVFSFLSGLYFRGKLAYARHFARPPANVAGSYVITSNAGLMPAETPINVSRLEEFARTPIDLDDPAYAEPLKRSAREVQSLVPAAAQVVLLGSIATSKYVDLLVECFGERLAFPREFVGRGDMSRGGLMLRAVAAEVELEYSTFAGSAPRKGKRPPKLERIPTKSVALRARRKDKP